MLIKRGQREARRPTLAADLPVQASAGVDVAASAPLGSRGRRPCRPRHSAARRRPQGRGRPAAASGATLATRKNVCTHCSVGCTVIAKVTNGVWTGQEPGWDSPINRGSHCCKGAAVRDDVLSERRLRYPTKLVNGKWIPNLLGSSDRRDRRQVDGDTREVRSRVGVLARLRQVHQ